MITFAFLRNSADMFLYFFLLRLLFRSRRSCFLPFFFSDRLLKITLPQRLFVCRREWGLMKFMAFIRGGI